VQSRSGSANTITQNTEAYQLYLRGRYYWNRRTAEMLKKANEYFQQAIEKDPSYGLAYAGLAESYVLFTYYEVLSPGNRVPKRRQQPLRRSRSMRTWPKHTLRWGGSR